MYFSVEGLITDFGIMSPTGPNLESPGETKAEAKHRGQPEKIGEPVGKYNDNFPCCSDGGKSR